MINQNKAIEINGLDFLKYLRDLKAQKLYNIRPLVDCKLLRQHVSVPVDELIESIDTNPKLQKQVFNVKAVYDGMYCRVIVS